MYPPAQLVDIPDDPTIDNGKVLVYRESAYNAAGIPMVFGQGEADHKELWNSDFVELEYDEGDKVFFVRSNQADLPYKLPVHVTNDKKICLKGYTLTLIIILRLYLFLLGILIIRSIWLKFHVQVIQRLQQWKESTIHSENLYQ